MPYTQDARCCQLFTPLGKDELLVAEMTASEAISDLFELSLDLVSEKSSIGFTEIIGRNVTLRVELKNGRQRYFNGYVSRFSQGVSNERFVHYSAEIVPWTWFLTKTADCRIFQDKTVPEIIQEVFGEWDFADFRVELTGSYQARTYCVQYRESDFAFLSRLMEEEGISYYFDHQEGQHTLVLVDSSSSAPAFSAVPGVEYAPGTDKAVKGGEIDEWVAEQELHSGRIAFTDYNFETPSDDLQASTGTKEVIGSNTRFELFEYPGLYGKQAEGERYSRLRIEAEEADAVAVRGRSDCAEFAPGHALDLEKHYRPDFNKRYLLTHVVHHVVEGVGYEPTTSSYENTFHCIPHSVQYRPRLRTEKPTIQGVQTAVVVGPSGEEIYVDRYGRVKLQFHWDRRGKRDENSSCWVRVSQAWAGKGWGWVSIPRIGQEVIVEFIDGDPDRPIVTGRVYNAELMPPYDLPGHQTRSAFKSRSSKGGVTANYNEIRFEDLKGKEQIFINAERDLDQRVENDSRTCVENDLHLIVQNDRKELIQGSNHVRVKGDHLDKVDGNRACQVGSDHEQKVGNLYALDSGQEIHLKAGMKVVIEAGMQLSLKGAGGFIDIGPAGISISGTLVNINSGGAAASGSGSSPEDPEEPDEADDGSAGGAIG